MTVAADTGALTATVASDPTVRSAFSGSGEGNMSLVVGPADPTARVRLAGALGVQPGALVFMQQVHGGQVAVVTAVDRGRGLSDHAAAVPGVDALVTFEPDVALVVMVADCVPVIVVDGVVAATLTTMTPPQPAAVTALVGPAIGGCCYEVEPDLADAVAAQVPAARATTTWGTPALDLPAAVDAQLRAANVGAVRRVGGCTRCEGTRWFSHRRAPGVGRQAAAVVRRSRRSGEPVGAPRGRP